ncbi:FtsX-like permease family protein [Amycolatopsis sp. cg13]|uniref:FtsX-like permease family protein n=1 Tax=Amycolatopsis sp. cg13 TaxID=3238807 RepID=UPI003524CD64
MIIFRLALRSLRHRPASFVASFVSLFLGATILMTFASLLDTRANVDESTGRILTIMASAVGGWGLVLVVVAVMSTLGLLVRQRDTELALLKSIGATPAQIGKLIVGEALSIAIIAFLAAITPAVFTGRLVVDLLKNAQRLPERVPAEFGPFAISIGLGITLLAAGIAAAATAWRRARSGVREGLLTASIGDGRPGWVRLIAGLLVLATGISAGVLTATVFTGREPALMAIGGQGAILSAVGFALLAPTLLAVITRAVAKPLRRTGASGHLAVLNLRGQTQQLAGALVPNILFTGMATGTLYMQSIENSAATGARTEIARSIETLNYVVVGMVALFAAIMLVNTLIATTIHRRREFGQQRLAGSTPPQVLGMVGLEGAVLASTGVLFGSIASVATVVPYSLVKTGSVLPDATITIYLGVVLIACALTLTSSVGTARQAIRVPAVQACR